MARAYFGTIENGVHRVRDGKPRQDACRTRKGNLPGALAAFNNLALWMLRVLGHNNIAQAMEELSRRQALALAVR